MNTSCKAFTVIELLIVISVIALLAGIAFPLMGTAGERGREKGTLALIKTVKVAIATYQTKDVTVNGQWRPMWDLDLNGIIDGNPEADAALSGVAPDWYRGLGLQLGIDEQWLDKEGRVKDAWGTPLRIRFGNDLDGVDGVGIWSAGKNRVTNADGTDVDDIVSWKVGVE